MMLNQIRLIQRFLVTTGDGDPRALRDKKSRGGKSK
jgi:hypothetical protein